MGTNKIDFTSMWRQMQLRERLNLQDVTTCMDIHPGLEGFSMYTERENNVYYTKHVEEELHDRLR